MRVSSLAIVASLFFGGGCSSVAGYRSQAVPEVTVVPEASLGKLRRRPSTITLIRPRPKDLTSVVNALLDRVANRRARYVSHLEASWTEAHEDGVYRCGARIRAVVLVAADGSKTPEAEAVAVDGTAPADFGRGNWYGIEGLPSTDAISRTRQFDPDPDLRIRLPGFRQWGLKMDPPVCVQTPDAANDRVVLDAKVY